MSITVAVTRGLASDISGRTSYTRRMVTPSRHLCTFRRSDGYWECPHNHVVPNALTKVAAERAAAPYVASLVRAPLLAN